MIKKCANPDCNLGESGIGLFMCDDSYCSECGNILVPKEKVSCHCGHRLGDNDGFCSGCGLPREEALKPKPEVEAIITPSEAIGETVCPECGTEMIWPPGYAKYACPKCDFDLGGGGA